MRFALSGFASLTLHGALLGAALGVAWQGPSVDAPRIEVEIVFGQPEPTAMAAEPEPVAVSNPLAAEAVPIAAPIAAAAAEAVPRPLPAAPAPKPQPRLKRPAAPMASPAPQEQPAPETASAEPAGPAPQAVSGGPGSMEVALSALPWQPHGRPKPNAPPSYGGNPAPVYPAQARRRGIQGQVVVRAEVDRDGRAARVEVARSSGHALLDEAALAGVREWRFAPAEVDGELSAGAVEVPITFKLVD